MVNRRARVAIKVWAALTVVFLAVNFLLIALVAPVLFPSEWSALDVQVHRMVAAFARPNLASGLNDLVDVLFLAIVPLGVLLLLGMLGRRVVGGLRRWWSTHRILTAALAVVVAGALVIQAGALVSNVVPHRAPSVAVSPASTTPAEPPALPTGVPTSPAPTAAPVATPTATPTSPAPLGPVYVVQPSDTLWDLASRYLGNPLRYEELFVLNRGISQVDGHTLVDPNLIYPGMHLRFPADATGVPTTSLTSAQALQAQALSLGGGGALMAAGLSP